MTSKVFVQRGPAAETRDLHSPSSSSGVHSNAAGNFNPQVNRMMADFGARGSLPTGNAYQHNPSRKFDGAFDDEKSEYSCMSMPQFFNMGHSVSGLPIVNYRAGVVTTDRKQAIA
jgi:hypothetical protein